MAGNAAKTLIVQEHQALACVNQYHFFAVLPFPPCCRFAGMAEPVEHGERNGSTARPVEHGAKRQRSEVGIFSHIMKGESMTLGRLDTLEPAMRIGGTG